MNVLDIPMQENDAGAKTIGEFLRVLLARLWIMEDAFSGKRPFGNSGWKSDVYEAMIRAGAIKGSFDVDGYVNWMDEAAGERLILAAIEKLT